MGGDGLARTSCGTGDGHGEACQLGAEFHVDGIGEAGTVGVEAAAGIFIEANGVDRTQGGRGGIDLVAVFERGEFVRHGDVYADEAQFSHRIEGFSGAAFLNLHADVADAFVHGIERRLMHLR